MSDMIKFLFGIKFSFDTKIIIYIFCIFFNRIGKKAFLDIKNRRITPGNPTQLQSDMSNLSRIAYYFAIQNLIFYSLQSALFIKTIDFIIDFSYFSSQTKIQ